MNEICTRTINENIRRVELGEELTLPLSVLNHSCKFKKFYEEYDKQLRGIRNNYEKGKDKDYHKKYHQRPEVKARKKEYFNEYKKRPEVIAKRKKYLDEYNKRPEVIARKREYSRRSDIKAKRKIYDRTPDILAKKKEYRNRPDVKARRSEYAKKYGNRPEVLARRRRLYIVNGLKYKAREYQRKRLNIPKDKWRV